MRLSAVTSRPNQAARPSWPMTRVWSSGMGPWTRRAAHWKTRGSPKKSPPASGARAWTVASSDAQPQHGKADEEARERAGDADVEERAPVGDGAADADEGAERPDQADGGDRERDEEGQRGVDAVVAGGERSGPSRGRAGCSSSPTTRRSSVGDVEGEERAVPRDDHRPEAADHEDRGDGQDEQERGVDPSGATPIAGRRDRPRDGQPGCQAVRRRPRVGPEGPGEPTPGGR